MDSADTQERFPRLYAAVAAVAALGLLSGGFALWLPACGGPSTAKSDLGLALIGGGLAISAGFGVAVVVFAAERRFDRALRHREEAAERESLKLTLSMTEKLRGVDLHGRDLRGVILRHKDLRNADLRRANLSGATLAGVNLEEALLNDADLHGATLGPSGYPSTVTLNRADLTGANLRGAIIRGDIRMAVLRGADLRGADLSRTQAVHPHPEMASAEQVATEAALFEGARYDAKTRWPAGVDPDAVGAIRT